MNIYVASSWRNPHQPGVVQALTDSGHDVYDFRNPEFAFHWEDVGIEYEQWTFEEFETALDHPLSVDAYQRDHDAMRLADVGIMVMPCGASSHLEIGYFVGAGKPCAIFMSKGRPELMYKEVDLLTDDFDTIQDWLCELVDRGM